MAGCQFDRQCDRPGHWGAASLGCTSPGGGQIVMAVLIRVGIDGEPTLTVDFGISVTGEAYVADTSVPEPSSLGFWLWDCL